MRLKRGFEVASLLVVLVLVLAQGIHASGPITNTALGPNGVGNFPVLNATQIYWNGLNRTDAVANPTSTASYIISTDGTTTFNKNGTDGQICDRSTNASQLINNAGGNLTNGGNIYIAVGTYLIDNIRITQSNVALVGSDVQKGFDVGDANGTCFVPTANTVSMISFIGNEAHILYGCSVQGINFYDPTGTYGGSTAYNAVGIELNGTEQFKITDCSFRLIKYGAVKIDTACWTGLISNDVFWYCGSLNYPCLNFNSSSSGSSDINTNWKVDHCAFEQDDPTTIYICNTLQTEITGNVFEGDANQKCFINCTGYTDQTDIHDNPWFWRNNGTYDVQVVGMSYVSHNYFTDALGTIFQGAIDTQGADDIIDHNIINTYPTYGITIGGANNTVDHNTLNNNGGIYLSSYATNTILDGNNYNGPSCVLVDDGTNTGPYAEAIGMLIPVGASTSSATFVLDFQCQLFNVSAYSNIISVKLKAVLVAGAGSNENASIKLYDHALNQNVTNSDINVSGAAAYSTNCYESVNFAANLASGARTFFTYVQSDGTNTIQFNSIEVVVKYYVSP